MEYETEDTPSSGSGNLLEEHKLVIRAQEGDQSAFEVLFERYNDRICHYMSRMVGDDGTGCELTQEVFLKAWEALPGLRDPSRFASWLYRIATNRAYNYQQHAKLLHIIPWEEYAMKEETPSIAGPEEQVEEAELLKLALARVSPTYRPCLILYVVEEYSQRQIAELLQIKESSIGRYVSRGKEELRHIYQRLANDSELSIRGGKRNQ
jgi:RNA polymerase sigma-70 factor (ECF subfamily)